MIRGVLSEDEEEKILVGDLVEVFGEEVKNLEGCLDILMRFYSIFFKEVRPYIIGEPLFMALDNRVGELLDRAMEKDNGLYNPYFNLNRIKKRYAAFMEEIDEDREKFNKKFNRMKWNKEKRDKVKEPYQGDRLGRVYLDWAAGFGNINNLREVGNNGG